MNRDSFPEVGGKFAEKYRLLEKLKEAENLVIYHAVEIAYDRDVTLKLMRNQDTDAFESFQKNSKLFSKLKNPFTSTLFFFGKHEDVLYLALEFIEGEDLRSFLHPNPRPKIKEVVNIFRQALFSLREAHSLGIVHGDLKLKNIMVIANDEDDVLIKMRDFQLVNFSSTWIEKDAEDISFKQDIEALGRILLSLLVGSTTSDTFPNQIEVPLPLKRIIKKMLAKKDAYEDVNTILSDLGSPTLLDAISADRKKTKKIYIIGFAMLALIFGTLAWTSVLFFSDNKTRPESTPLLMRSPESETLSVKAEGKKAKEVPTLTKMIETPMAHESRGPKEVKTGSVDSHPLEKQVKKSRHLHRPKKKKVPVPPKNEVAEKEPELVIPKVEVKEEEVVDTIKKPQPLKFTAKASEKIKKTPKKKEAVAKKKVTPKKAKKVEEKKSAPISF